MKHFVQGMSDGLIVVLFSLLVYSLFDSLPITALAALVAWLLLLGSELLTYDEEDEE